MTALRTPYVPTWRDIFALIWEKITGKRTRLLTGYVNIFDAKHGKGIQ
jgi:hypothetical protein